MNERERVFQETGHKEKGVQPKVRHTFQSTFPPMHVSRNLAATSIFFR